MIELRTPRGLRVQVPENLSEDPSPRFGCEQTAALKQYYSDNGYVIVTGLVDPASCEHLRVLWASEVKPSDAFIYRQATAKAERHKFNAQGWVINPILNLQSVDPKRYPQFRSFATDRILTAPGLVGAFRALLGEQPKIVQSMYFEGNSATWEHQDSYYLDSERVGSMAAAWIAMQDIAATTGRFFVCPKSHLLDLGPQTFQDNIADHHEDYIQSVVPQRSAISMYRFAHRACRRGMCCFGMPGPSTGHSTAKARNIRVLRSPAMPLLNPIASCSCRRG